jgi:hypothetical protein
VGDAQFLKDFKKVGEKLRFEGQQLSLRILQDTDFTIETPTPVTTTTPSLTQTTNATTTTNNATTTFKYAKQA